LKRNNRQAETAIIEDYYVNACDLMGVRRVFVSGRHKQKPEIPESFAFSGYYAILSLHLITYIRPAGGGFLYFDRDVKGFLQQFGC